MSPTPEELARRYNAGETLLELLNDFDGGYTKLRNVLLRQGVEFRAQKPIALPTPPGLENLYRSGMSLAKTGERYGLGPAAVRRMLIDAGVTIRERGRPLGG